MIKLKRIYEKPEKDDGFRILVDRLWPRGISKKEAKVDLWFKEVAPSNELRRWFHKHDDWGGFQKRYKEELRKSEFLEGLRKIIKNHKITTLLFAAKDEAHNNAVVLKSLL